MNKDKKAPLWKVPAEIAGTYLVVALVALYGIIILSSNEMINIVLSLVAICLILAAGGLYIYYDVTGNNPIKNLRNH